MTRLADMVELARERGYAIDLAIYGGVHLDDYEGGARITAPGKDPDEEVEAGIRRLKELPWL